MLSIVRGKRCLKGVFLGKEDRIEVIRCSVFGTVRKSRIDKENMKRFILRKGRPPEKPSGFKTCGNNQLRPLGKSER